ncbi:MAG: GTP cyclohydrolase I FolE [Deltaproteobacteria bacterium]|nr:GTP cyclohydrolase I FolE [Deltaproteobacteria bacterium]MBI3293427.1 GTP cyclohydrolase I FolE [Deltaproteobacteria bacterium]
MAESLSSQIHKRLKRSDNPASVFGIRTGGLFVAQELGKRLSLPLTDAPVDNSLIVTDAVGEGQELPTNDSVLTAALHVKANAAAKPKFFIEETNKTIVYPWERQGRADMEALVARSLRYLGEDPDRQGLLDTPKRVIKSWDSLFSGYRQDPMMVLGTQFDEFGSRGIVLCKDIEMYSTCEHHMLPFFGKASVGYIPRNGRIVGLSKLARLVEVFSRRLQNQERLTRQVAEALHQAIDPLAVGVIIEAEHFCMRARGVQKQSSRMVTNHMLGNFDTDLTARAEFYKLLGQ